MAMTGVTTRYTLFGNGRACGVRRVSKSPVFSPPPCKDTITAPLSRVPYSLAPQTMNREERP